MGIIVSMMINILNKVFISKLRQCFKTFSVIYLNAKQKKNETASEIEKTKIRNKQKGAVVL